MKKLVLCFAVVLSCILTSASTASVFQIEETSISEREIILRAQLGQTKVRSVAYYDVIGVKDDELSIISVEFRLAGEFMIKVENGLTKCYETRVVIFQEEGAKVENISFVDMQRGDYTLTITDVKTGKIVSGNFSI